MLNNNAEVPTSPWSVQMASLSATTSGLDLRGVHTCACNTYTSVLWHGCILSLLQLHLQYRPDLFHISMETAAVKLTHFGLTCGHKLSFCSLLVPHLAPLSVCVSAWVCMCVLGATLAVSQWYNCTSLDIKIDTFNSLSTFLSIHPTGQLRLPPPPQKNPH